MKSVGAGMAKASMPERHIGVEGDGTTACRLATRVKIAGGVTSVQNLPGVGILDRKTMFVKLNSNRMFTGKSADRT